MSAIENQNKSLDVSESDRTKREATEVLLHADSIIDFVAAGEFSQVIADKYTDAREKEIDLEKAIAAIPVWMTTKFDRLDFRFTTSFRYSLSTHIHQISEIRI